MRVLITGGSGFVGKALSAHLRQKGHDPVISTRRASDAPDRMTWNPPDLIPAENLTGIDAVVNLAGASIFAERWSEKRKAELRTSRIETTRALVDSLRRAESRPRILVNASAIGYYGDRCDETVDEDSSPGSDFLAVLCRDWETEAMKAEGAGIRVVIVRFGIILGRGGGALEQMLPSYRNYVGGYIGSGRQWMSWVHMDDVTGFINFALENDYVKGCYNLSAPEPVRNREFGRILGKVMKRPSIFPVPGFVLKLALGEFADVLLTGQKVIPGRTLETGYRFRYDDLEDALKSILYR
jgi:hypothetical protein